MKDKVVLDLHYSSKTNERYQEFIQDLESEGWTVESTYINHVKGTFRTMLRRVVK